MLRIIDINTKFKEQQCSWPTLEIFKDVVDKLDLENIETPAALVIKIKDTFLISEGAYPDLIIIHLHKDITLLVDNRPISVHGFISNIANQTQIPYPRLILLLPERQTLPDYPCLKLARQKKNFAPTADNYYEQIGMLFDPSQILHFVNWEEELFDFSNFQIYESAIEFLLYCIAAGERVAIFSKVVDSGALYQLHEFDKHDEKKSYYLDIEFIRHSLYQMFFKYLRDIWEMDTEEAKKKADELTKQHTTIVGWNLETDYTKEETDGQRYILSQVRLRGLSKLPDNIITYGYLQDTGLTGDKIQTYWPYTKRTMMNFEKKILNGDTKSTEQSMPDIWRNIQLLSFGENNIEHETHPSSQQHPGINDSCVLPHVAQTGTLFGPQPRSPSSLGVSRVLPNVETGQGFYMVYCPNAAINTTFISGNTYIFTEDALYYKRAEHEREQIIIYQESLDELKRYLGITPQNTTHVNLAEEQLRKIGEITCHFCSASSFPPEHISLSESQDIRNLLKEWPHKTVYGCRKDGSGIYLFYEILLGFYGKFKESWSSYSPVTPCPSILNWFKVAFCDPNSMYEHYINSIKNPNEQKDPLAWWGDTYSGDKWCNCLRFFGVNIQQRANKETSTDHNASDPHDTNPLHDSFSFR